MLVCVLSPSEPVRGDGQQESLEGIRAKKGCYDCQIGDVRVLMNIARAHLLINLAQNVDKVS
jgi:hypothetical protein